MEASHWGHRSVKYGEFSFSFLLNVSEFRNLKKKKEIWINALAHLKSVEFKHLNML